MQKNDTWLAELFLKKMIISVRPSNDFFYLQGPLSSPCEEAHGGP